MIRSVKNNPKGEEPEAPADLQHMLAFIRDTLAQINDLGEVPANDAADIHRLRQSNAVLVKHLLKLDKMMEDCAETEKKEAQDPVFKKCD